MDWSLVRAVEENKVDDVEALLNAGASPDACGSNGCPVLVTACFRGFNLIVQRLLQKKANVNKADSAGMTALMSAAFDGYESLIDMLLSAKAEVDLKDEYGLTALHCAVLNDHSNIVRILLENGCDSNIKANDGKTALQLAVGADKKDAADGIKAFTVSSQTSSPSPLSHISRTSAAASASNVHLSTPVTQRMRTTSSTQQLRNESSEKDREIAKMRRQIADLQITLRVDAKVEETSNDDNIASDKKDDARPQRRVSLVVLLCVGSAVLAVVLQGIIYLTGYSIDTSLREPTRIREKAAVPLATDSDNDQVTSVELLKIADEVGSHWHSIGIHLGFSGETLRQYEKQFNEPSRLLFEILDKWRKQKGKQATKNAVLEACRQAGARGACERIFVR